MKPIKNILGLCFVLGLIYFAYSHWHLFEASQNIALNHIAILTGCILLAWLINSFQVLILLRAQSVPVGMFENLVIQTTALLGNYLPMKAGSVLRFRYFKTVHGVEYTRFGGIVSLRAIILFFASGLLGFLSLLFGIDIESNRKMALLAILGIMTLVPLSMLLFNTRRNYKNARLDKLAGLFFSAFNTIKENPLIPLKILLLMLAQFSILAIRLYVSFEAMGVNVSFYALAILAPISTFLSFVTIIPGNLGLREWAIGLLSSVLGYDFDTAMFAGMIDRTVLIGCAFTFGTISFAHVWKKLE